MASTVRREAQAKTAQRAVNLIYVHQIGASPSPQLITELSDLAARVQASYMRLIKQARGS